MQDAAQRTRLRSDFTPGDVYARTLWDGDWLAAHTWRDEAEPDAPATGELCFTGPAGTGKTRNILEWFHKQCLDFPGCRVLLAREFREDQTQAAMKTLQEQVYPEGIFGDAMSGAPVRWHTGEQAYLYDNGSTMVVKGLRDSRGIYSQQYDHVFVNEAGAPGISEADVDQLKRAKRNGKTDYSLLILDLNPEYEMHWLHQRCDDGHTVEVRTRHTDNPVITASYLHDLATMRDPIERARLYEGRRVSHRPGAYYQEQLARAREAGRIKAVPFEPGAPVYTCWDLGWSDYTAVWFFQVIRGEWRWIDYYENHQQELDHYTGVLARKILQRRFTYGTHYLPHDARNKTLAAKGKSIEDQLRDLGVTGRIVPAMEIQAQHNAVRANIDLSWYDDGTWVKPQEGDTAREGVRWGVQRLLGYHAEKDERLNVFRPTPAHDLNSHGASAYSTGVRGFQPATGGYTRPATQDAPPWQVATRRQP